MPFIKKTLNLLLFNIFHIYTVIGGLRQPVQKQVHPHDSVISYNHQINGRTSVANLGSTIYLRNATCYANGATITIVATGGTPPYQFSLNGGSFQTSNLYTNLGPIVL